MCSTKHTNFEKFVTFLIFLALLPQNSAQQELTTKINTIETHCVLSYDLQGRYNCHLFNVRTNSSTDVLEIVASHNPNKTDADVHGVIHINSMIHEFNGEVLRKFTNLKRLQLTSVFLQSINPNAFEVCDQLEELDIGSNYMTEVPSQMLKNCGNLKTFLAVSSRFTTIPADFFGDTFNLRIFNASHGRLTSIPDNLLQNMMNLRSFRIWNCQVTQLSPNNFINAMDLEEFDISGNHFNDSQAIMNLLNGHTRLKRIAISFNPFTMFNLSLFSQFQNLEELTFGGIKIGRQIEWQFLPSSLQILYVYEIGEEIPENAFVGLQNLKKLYISGYGITALQKNTLNPLTNLDRLSIVGTSLKILHPQLFTNKGNLSTLDLSFNKIEELPEGVFAPLVSLGRNGGVAGLSMVLNNIRELSANSFGQHPHLKYIDFSYNLIDKIQREIFSRFHPVPAIADFSRNVCIDWPFSNEANLDTNKLLELCFNNYEGITTTTPGGCGSVFRKFEIFLIIFIGFVNFFIKL